MAVLTFLAANAYVSRSVSEAICTQFLGNRECHYPSCISEEPSARRLWPGRSRLHALSGGLTILFGLCPKDGQTSGSVSGASPAISQSTM